MWNRFCPQNKSTWCWLSFKYFTWLVHSSIHGETGSCSCLDPSFPFLLPLVCLIKLLLRGSLSGSTIERRFVLHVLNDLTSMRWQEHQRTFRKSSGWTQLSSVAEAHELSRRQRGVSVVSSPAVNEQLSLNLGFRVNGPTFLLWNWTANGGLTKDFFCSYWCCPVTLTFSTLFGKKRKRTAGSLMIFIWRPFMLGDDAGSPPGIALGPTCRWKRTAACRQGSFPDSYWTRTGSCNCHTSHRQRETALLK